MAILKTSGSKKSKSKPKPVNKKSKSKPKLKSNAGIKTKSKGKGILSRLSKFFNRGPVASKKSISPHLAKLGLSNFFRNGPKPMAINPMMARPMMSRPMMSRPMMARPSHSMGSKTRRIPRRRMMRPMQKVGMKPNPIKLVVPPYINKKYVKKGRVDWVKYSK